MPVLPNFLERLMFVNFNLGPGPVLDIFSAVVFRVVLAAVRLGVFETLQARPLTIAEVARAIKADEQGTTRLLESLVAFGYLRKEKDGYANTPMAEKWLVRSSPVNVSDGFEYWGTLLSDLWGNLEESICTGRSPVNLYQWIEHQPEVSQAFQDWMVALARITAGEVLGKVKIPAGARRLLDVGGGHAAYSLAFCGRYPGLSATVFDSPQALKSARANIAEAKMGDRVTVQEGDFLEDELGSGYDVVLVFNIVHGFSPEQNAMLLKKAAAALNPGGLVVVAEQVSSEAPGPASRAAVQVLGMSYYHLLNGRIFTYEEIAGWLTTAGFANIRGKNLLKAPGSSLIMGSLP